MKFEETPPNERTKPTLAMTIALACVEYFELHVIGLRQVEGFLCLEVKFMGFLRFVGGIWKEILISILVFASFSSFLYN